jgi:hypothetical protein
MYILSLLKKGSSPEIVGLAWPWRNYFRERRLILGFMGVAEGFPVPVAQITCRILL